MTSRWWRRLACAGTLALLSACGGGAGPAGADGPASAAAELRSRTAKVFAQRRVSPLPSATLRRAAMPMDPVNLEVAVEQLLDFAEAHFPDLFPLHQETTSSPPFLFRHYPQTGVYVGVVVTPGMGYEVGGVYAMGGSFGSSPSFIGPLDVLLDFDGDGVENAYDVSPLDALCASGSDASEGECHLRTMARARARVVASGGGRLYFATEGDSPMLYAYNLQTRHFIGRTSVSGFTPMAYAYSADHGRFYVGDTAGTVHVYGEALDKWTIWLARVGGPVQAIVAVGKYVLVDDGRDSYVFDRHNVQTDKAGSRYAFGKDHDWSVRTSRLYHLRHGELLFDSVDQATGKVASSGQAPYALGHHIVGPVRVDPSGSRLVLGSGQLFMAPALSWAGKYSIGPIVDALWLADGELLVASGDAAGPRLQRLGADFTALETTEPLEGELLAMVADAGVIYIVSQRSTHVDIAVYVPSDDNDGDGVANADDRFPLDKAAATDSDGDGSPDAWLPGRTSADSTTGLTLDAYPADASCQDPTQGAGPSCDSALHAPQSSPDRVVGDGEGTVFMHGNGWRRIYRWSSGSGGYLPPLAVGQPDGHGELIGPSSFIYAPAHRRLYLGYATGRITYIDASGGGEKVFSSVRLAVGGLAAAGNFVVAQDGTTGWTTHYVFDQAGAITATRDWYAMSRHHEWAPHQGRLYFFGDQLSPNHLLHHEIDPLTGRITATGESPHRGDPGVWGPLRVSIGGEHIALRNGDIYSAVELTVTKKLGAQWVDQAWLADGRLAGLSATGAGARLTVYSNALAVQREHPIDGQPVAVIAVGTSAAVVTRLGGMTRVTRLPP